jgi:hypothetical protein
VNVVRGELSQALEAVEGMPNAAEARGNRGALLNVIRGRAMILMFIGRIVEARDQLERAVEMFGASEKADRLAARAAGQDAGVRGVGVLDSRPSRRGGCANVRRA